MDLFLVFTTLVFCSIVMIVYLQANSAFNASLVSPVKVLELGDSQLLFEQEEYVSLRGIYCDLKNNAEIMKKRFCLSFNGFENKGFLLNDNFPLEGMEGLTSDNLCEKVYNFNVDGVNLKVERGGLGKRFMLEAQKDEGIKFNVGFEYVFLKEYLLTESDCE